MAAKIQQYEQPPVAYATLRAHPFAVTATHFANSLRLVSGDEGGWCFVWNVVTRRPIVIWRPHGKAVVSVKFLPAEHQPENALLLLTHGRDHKLRVYLVEEEGVEYSTKLPMVNDIGDNWTAPRLVYEQDVNALNFCAAAIASTAVRPDHAKYLLFAVPSTMASENIDVYKIDRQAENQLTRLAFGMEPPVPPNQPLFPDSETSRNAGIVMALLVVELPEATLLVAGYESGLVSVYKLVAEGKPELVYATKCHSQPILSLDLDRENFAWFMSSSADSKLVQHPLLHSSSDPWGVMPLATYNTKHSGLASLDIRSDSKIFATAGWDGMIRIFTTKPKKDSFTCLAVFKGGRQNGVSTVSFSPIETDGPKSSSITLADKLQLRRTTDAHLLASGGKDGRISIYSLY